MMGVNINDSTAPYTAMICDGTKTIETRRTRSLDSVSESSAPESAAQLSWHTPPSANQSGTAAGESLPATMPGIEFHQGRSTTAQLVASGAICSSTSSQLPRQ